ncbi:MAG: DUF2147 domain-containing protein [Bacteroidota bacterium]
MSVRAQKADDILGTYWVNEKQGKVEIYKESNKYFGKIIWRKDDRKDIKNPDPSLRSRSVIGMTFLKDFVFSEGEYVDGFVYSLDNGNTYSGKMWLEKGGSMLKMRGFIGISLLGRTATLERVKD